MKTLVFTTKLAYGTLIVLTTLMSFVLGAYGLLDATGTTDGQIQAIFEAPERLDEFFQVMIDAGNKYLNQP